MRLLRTVGQVVRRRAPQLQLVSSPSRVASVVAFCSVAVMVLVALALPDFLSAYENRRQLVTMRRMFDVAIRIEEGHRSAQVIDGWGRAVRAEIRGREHFTLRSAGGTERSRTVRRAARSGSISEDLVIEDGAWVQYDERF